MKSELAKGYRTPECPRDYSDRANQPMLPVVRHDDCDALHFLVVSSYEPNMILKSRNILPAVEPGSINQQSDFPMLTEISDPIAVCPS